MLDASSFVRLILRVAWPWFAGWHLHHTPGHDNALSPCDFLKRTRVHTWSLQKPKTIAADFRQAFQKGAMPDIKMDAERLPTANSLSSSRYPSHLLEMADSCMAGARVVEKHFCHDPTRQATPKGGTNVVAALACCSLTRRAGGRLVQDIVYS
ncbi:hypothetical protein LX36DRAFT_663430 [Colletotrichum falcatum]|nr:hypothetical protein LX36DRAFT_663430 [Colletotrichum falcatum]